jgi:magnesium-protoporphyrin IX monomethyl ester (oxidative) cyclase
MYVRDHARPELHAAFGLDPTEYDFQVFRITTEISKQVFPLALDLDSPAFAAGLERLRRLMAQLDRAKARGGLLGTLQVAGLAIGVAATFLRLYLLPVKRNELPAQVTMRPVW